MCSELNTSNWRRGLQFPALQSPHSGFQRRGPGLHIIQNIAGLLLLLFQALLLLILPS